MFCQNITEMDVSHLSLENTEKWNFIKESHRNVEASTLSLSSANIPPHAPHICQQAIISCLEFTELLWLAFFVDEPRKAFKIWLIILCDDSKSLNSTRSISLSLFLAWITDGLPGSIYVWNWWLTGCLVHALKFRFLECCRWLYNNLCPTWWCHNGC